jgi:hypothetical protein
VFLIKALATLAALVLDTRRGRARRRSPRNAIEG